MFLTLISRSQLFQQLWHFTDYILDNDVRNIETSNNITQFNFLVKNKQNKKVFGTRKYVEKHNFNVRQREFKSDNYIAGTPEITL